MRTLIVSAHYPPDFVSGGTLVPQRIARGLAARGHTVSVYAGSLDRAHAPMSTWDEDDGHGVHIRWVSSYPWIGWADELTYDNPAMTAAFATWASSFRPDVVHLHSLQSLGVGLVEQAAALGARVVLTAHDFWWQCARQFLVDREARPCPLVVAVGGCQCEAGREHLDRRNQRMDRALRAVDVVLAPSASAARILVANGVDPARVRVDENGMDESASRRVVTAHTGPVRLLYTGGPDAMKGWPILCDAVRIMAASPGWAMTAYGVADSVAAADLPAAVTVSAAYRPDELSDVLDRHDVLVLPSVARETYSLITREALLAGLAVVTTDVPGPLEVVDHGRNGLVVPAGDAEVLAATLLEIVTNPSRLETLRSAEPPSVRTLATQLDGLESLYATLLAAPEPDSKDPLPVDPPGGVGPIPLPTELARPLGDPTRRGEGGVANPGRRHDTPDVRRVLFIVGIQGAPLRYRAQLPAAGLRRLGVETEIRWYRDPELPALAAAADAVVCYRVPATVQLLGVLDSVRRDPRAVPLLFDVDDLIFDPSLRGRVRGLSALPVEEQELWWHGVARYRTTMEACDLFVGSTEQLCDRVTEVSGLPTRRFANGVGTALGRLSDAAVRRPRTPGPLRIGYFSGTTTHDEDWASVEPAVLRVMGTHPDVELWLGGHLTPTPALSVVSDRVRRIPMRAWFELPDLLRDVDVNLAPLHLTGDPRLDLFNESKSAIKWSEAALVGTPSVCAPTEPFRELVIHGTSGMLPATVDDWATSMDRLLDDHAERARVGAAAKREAMLRLAPDLQARAYLSIVRHARRTRVIEGPRTRSSGWVDVADDEPWEEVVIDSLVVPGMPGEGSSVMRTPGRTHRLVKRAAAVYRDEGAAAVARRGAAALRRRF